MFYGAEQARIHDSAFGVLAATAAADVLEILFKRKLDTSQIFFALGEAIAHLHYLHYDGQLARSVGADGVARFAPG